MAYRYRKPGPEYENLKRYPEQLGRQFSSQDINSRLKSANHPTSATAASNKQVELLDTSSSDEAISASFFLKDDPNAEKKPAAKKSKSKLSSLKQEEKERRNSSEFGTKTKPQNAGNIDTLSRFRQLENEIKSRSQNKNKLLQSISDLDISSDLEIKRDVHQLKQGRGQSSAKTKKYDFDSSESLAKDELDFLKPAKAGSKASIAETGATDVTSSKVKSVSFDPRVQQTSYSPELDSFLQQDSEASSLDDVLPSRANSRLKSLDDLLPSDSTSVSISEEYKSNIRTVDELQSDDDNEINSERTSLSASDTSLGGAGANFANIRSFEDLDLSPDDEPQLLHLAHSSPKPVQKTTSKIAGKTTSKASAEVVSSVEGLSPAVVTSQPDVFRSRSQEEVSSEASTTEIEEEYSADFDSVDEDTLKGTDTISTDISEAISVDAKSIPTESTVEDSYSASFESSTTSESSSSESSRLEARRVGVDSAVQTDPVTIQRDEPEIPAFMTSFYNPRNLISHEAMAVLTSYSPAVLALHDMLKQQLDLTREFVHQSQMLHERASSSLTADYHYSTVEDARTIIKQFRETQSR